MLQRTAARLACAACTLSIGTISTAQAEEPLMSALFTHHVILQRDRPIEIWGRANAGEEVTVTLSGATRRARADASGQWALAMPDLPAGGPHTLTARTASRLQNADDVLVGDVFLCSGQSNMEFSVKGSLNSRAEIAASANERIRQVTIAKVSSTTPRDGVDKTLEWKIAAPETTGDFSATCYYFARELQKTVDVPIGLIVSAWGGSKIEPWMSENAMRTVPGYENALAVSAEYRVDPSAAARHWGEYWQKWWRALGGLAVGREPWAATDDSATWNPAPAELTPWENWGVPALAPYDGMVWYRARVKLTSAQAKQAATLSLGQIDEVDLTFVNGGAVGSSPCCGERNYKLAAGALRAGDNLIVVNVLDTYASGGMYGPADKRVLVLADGTKVPLAGWEYSIAPGFTPPRAPWEPTAGIAMLYNAMIAPLGKYGLRGAVWYQGESNTTVQEGRAYQALLRALMADWRRQFASNIPFLVVQLANYGPVAKEPVESGWALTREAQRRAVAADGNAGLAVTYDIGNRDDVHPTNKQEVGRRLARAARAVVYGEKISASGAQPREAVREKTSVGPVGVTFQGFEGPLVVYNAKAPSAFELCGATEGSCRFVYASLNEDRVWLSVGEVPNPKRVRFCWADSPLCNLYDAAGLPVGPFEIEVRQ
jgi:sialate O-acetylesterase